MVFAAVVALLQRRIIYQPSTLPLADAIRRARVNGFESWENASGDLVGWRLPAKGQARATVLIFHGNAGWAGDRSYLAESLSVAGPADVYLMEYPGYGARAGSPSQASILLAAEEVFALLAIKTPLYLVSESLGTGPAAHIARRHGSEVAGLMLFVPYNNFVALAQRRFPVRPAQLILRDRYAPDEWLAEYIGPVGIVLAENDEVIPAELGQLLYDGISQAVRKKILRIQGAGHNDVAAQTPEWWKLIFEFWRAGAPAP